MRASVHEALRTEKRSCEGTRFRVAGALGLRKRRKFVEEFAHEHFRELPRPGSPFTEERTAAERSRFVRGTLSIRLEKRTGTLCGHIPSEKRQGAVLRAGQPLPLLAQTRLEVGDLDGRYIRFAPGDAKATAFRRPLAPMAEERRVDRSIDPRQGAFGPATCTWRVRCILRAHGG